jgi:predicted tellurium resistance membrane protein TerC
MRALLIAVQNEPAVLVYGAIAFLFLVGFALLISTAKWKRWVTGHKERILRREFAAFSTLPFP